MNESIAQLEWYRVEAYAKLYEAIDKVVQFKGAGRNHHRRRPDLTCILPCCYRIEMLKYATI